jgi:hemerythrin
LPVVRRLEVEVALLTWTNEYSVSVKAMDDQHAVLIDTLNELHAALMAGEAHALTGRILERLLDYTLTHFAAEEAMMEATGYPGLEEHRERHRALTLQVERFIARFRKGEEMIDIHLMDFLSDWLGCHILDEDRRYGPWVNERGVD